jgi:hypothetical protein
MMSAVDTPDMWEIEVHPDPGILPVLGRLDDANPRWVAKSPGGEIVTVVHDLDTDQYRVAYSTCAAVDIESNTATFETKECALDVTQQLVDSVLYEGTEGVEAVFRSVNEDRSSGRQ